MVADRSPPDDRRGVGELSDQLVDGAGVDAIVEFSTQSAVPTLDEVDDVHHEHERDRDVHVAVVARVDQSAVMSSHVVGVQLTPGECRQTARYEQAEYEALPVAVATQRPTERQSCRLLLHAQSNIQHKHSLSWNVSHRINESKFNEGIIYCKRITMMPHVVSIL